MKRVTALRLLLLLALAALLAAGCAKKPAPGVAVAPPAPPAEERQVVTQPAPQPAAGIREQVVSEAPAEAPVLAAAKGLQTVYFDYDQYTLTETAQQALAANAAWMKANGGAKVVIEGYCDERGSDEYNLALGDRRAKAAQAYLVSLGVAAGRLSTVSYGEESPVDPGHDEAAWVKNRRAEFKVIQ